MLGEIPRPKEAALRMTPRATFCWFAGVGIKSGERGYLSRRKTPMKETVRNGILKNVYRAGLAMAALSIASASAVYARPGTKETAEKPANVIAHVQLSGGPATRMLLVKEAGKKYLLLGSDSSSNVAIVDVSKPARARVVETSAAATRAPAAEMKDIASALTEFKTLEAENGIPTGPAEVQGFSGVTASIKDGHGLIYLANSNGLWIVKQTRRIGESEFYADPDADYYGGGD